MELLDLVIEVIGESMNFNDALQWDNYTNSFADIETIFLEDEISREFSAIIFAI